MKYVLIIEDGAADLPLDALGGKTPMEAANTRNIDRLAKHAVIGRVKTVPDGVPAGSDTAILSIFGHDPLTCYTGRSPLEAAALGVTLQEGDVSMRLNLVCLGDEGAWNDKLMRSHSGGAVEGEDAETLMNDLLKDEAFAKVAAACGFRVRVTNMYRHIAVLPESDKLTFELTPPHDILGQAIGGYMPKGDTGDCLGRLMQAAHAYLKNHPINGKRVERGLLPANGIWFWGSGKAVSLTSFRGMFGIGGAVVSAVPLVKGIARLSGLQAPDVEGANGEIETNYEGKLDAAMEALKTDDFAAIHLEAPDECGHMGDLPGKIKALEHIDARIVGPLAQRLDAVGDWRLLVMPDHPTPISTRTHSPEPVPFLLYDSRGVSGAGMAFDEKSARCGPLVDPGTGIMALLLEKTQINTCKG